jgi:hypothetical protein
VKLHIEPRVAIIGSCVTRDIWETAAVRPEQKKHLHLLARTSLASLFSEPVRDVTFPEQLPSGLSPWEVRMVAHDLQKSGLAELVTFRPSHLILDLIDERFDLLRCGDAVATRSWDLHLLGLDASHLANARLVRRSSAEAARLWRRGLARLKRFVDAQLPGVHLIIHDARCATEYLDADGVRRPFAATWEFWPGVPGRIEEMNDIFCGYIADVRGAFPAATYLLASADVALATVKHRWGLAPFHYVDDYYAGMWRDLEALGCGGGAERLMTA